MSVAIIDYGSGNLHSATKAFERAAIAAIRDGREKIELRSFDDPEIWRGVATPSRTTRPSGRDHAARAQM